MDVNKMFPSKYLSADDLQGKAVPVTIEEVVMEQVQGKPQPVLVMTGKRKGLVLNKTRALAIAGVLGTGETDRWPGKQITLFPVFNDFAGKEIVGVMERSAVDSSRHERPNFEPNHTQNVRAAIAESGLTPGAEDDPDEPPF